MDLDDGGASVAERFEAEDASWPVLADGDGGIAAAYGLEGVPAYFVVDPAGVLSAAITGSVSVADLAAATASDG